LLSAEKLEEILKSDAGWPSGLIESADYKLGELLFEIQTAFNRKITDFASLKDFVKGKDYLLDKLSSC